MSRAFIICFLQLFIESIFLIFTLHICRCMDVNKAIVLEASLYPKFTHSKIYWLEVNNQMLIFLVYHKTSTKLMQFIMTTIIYVAFFLLKDIISSHLISCRANISMLYSTICPIRFLRPPDLYNDSTFHDPIRKPLCLPIRLQFIRPAFLIWGFSTVLLLQYEVVNLMPNPQPGGPGNL